MKSKRVYKNSWSAVCIQIWTTIRCESEKQTYSAKCKFYFDPRKVEMCKLSQQSETLMNAKRKYQLSSLWRKQSLDHEYSAVYCKMSLLFLVINHWLISGFAVTVKVHWIAYCSPTGNLSMTFDLQIRNSGNHRSLGNGEQSTSIRNMGVWNDLELYLLRILQAPIEYS